MSGQVVAPLRTHLHHQQDTGYHCEQQDRSEVHHILLTGCKIRTHWAESDPNRVPSLLLYLQNVSCTRLPLHNVWYSLHVQDTVF